MPPVASALAFARFGLGARPGDLDRISADPRTDLVAELHSGDAALAGDTLQPSATIFFAIRQFLIARAAELKAGNTDLAATLGRAPQSEAYQAEFEARVEKARAVQIGFVERLVAFWSNHFTVSIGMNTILHGLVGSFEREAIRPYVLGNFHDMLLAATTHPAMLLYLNNASSFGPNSKLGLRLNRGLNENHARELLELHTVGVDAGYSQADVTAFARVLTGWTIDQNVKTPETCGRFVFKPAMHEPGPATVMGTDYPQAGQDQGLAVLADLAISPHTARHLAKKLAVHFVADEPPPALIETLASTFEETGGDLRALAAALVRADDSWAPPTKLRTPQEFVWAALRTLSLDLRAGFIGRAFVTLGQPIWSPPSPQGFSDDSGAWLAPDAMTNRLDIATDFATKASIDADPVDLARAVLGAGASDETMAAIANAESREQALALLLMSPEFQRR